MPDAGLRFASLGIANLARADLSGADLSFANLARADLEEADLSEAKLYGATLAEANMEGANHRVHAPGAQPSVKAGLHAPSIGRIATIVAADRAQRIGSGGVGESCPQPPRGP